ncbi:hypothetical protein AOQ84DRAFT_61879 [Glonium stellatum]|uniref:Uncharacterized protein n=1 Tax=Glonium stellatum TaxID=574774 RepID=A0A8E2EYI9_9PEZI|nr:hypothetical protein AOQ84DRAFT_61879 [Glonium stellatum]
MLQSLRPSILPAIWRVLVMISPEVQPCVTLRQCREDALRQFSMLSSSSSLRAYVPGKGWSEVMGGPRQSSSLLLDDCRRRNKEFGKGLEQRHAVIFAHLGRVDALKETSSVTCPGPPCSWHLRTCRKGGMGYLFKWTADGVHRTLIRLSPVLCSG